MIKRATQSILLIINRGLLTALQIGSWSRKLPNVVCCLLPASLKVLY